MTNMIVKVKVILTVDYSQYRGFDIPQCNVKSKKGKVVSKSV